MAGTMIPGSIVEVDAEHICLTSEADEELKNGKGDEGADVVAQSDVSIPPDGV